MGSHTQPQNPPGPSTGILKPEQLADREMRLKNMWDIVYTADENRRSELDGETEPERQEQKYHYFILGRAYDQDLNLVYDSRESNKKKSSENPTSQTDKETSSETESLSLGNNGLDRARDSITLYTKAQSNSANAQESIMREAQSEGATTNSPVSNPLSSNRRPQLRFAR